jgi:TRAP-type C4-dicarboxylate transport system permease large subunit
MASFERQVGELDLVDVVDALAGQVAGGLGVVDVADDQVFALLVGVQDVAGDAQLRTGRRTGFP